MIKFYKIPDEYFQRIHFVRPRFKSNIENVLLYMANECCKIEDCQCEEYKERITKAIRMFPGNLTVTDKTISNWRTEIPALFAFYEEDKATGITKTSKSAHFLHDYQDLTQFFRFFLSTFQLPGGHLKAKDNLELIQRGVKFKPARYIVNVLLEGNALLSESGSEKEMSLSAEEATYCILNDLRVTTGKRSPRKTAELILKNRKEKLKYRNPKDEQTFSLKGTPRTKGDVTRYAADILDYMEIASLLQKENRYYYLAPNQEKSIKALASESTYFTGYDSLYIDPNLNIKQVADKEIDWFQYVNENLNPDKFKTDVTTLISSGETIAVIIEERIKEIVTSEDTTKKDVGNIGETLVHGHEIARLQIAGYPDLAKLVQIVDSPSYHPGFDIDSFEGDEKAIHRYIEVKTTISKQKLQIFSFHMSPNEWSVAETHRNHYYVYRLTLSAKDKVLYILKNPVGLYKTDKIEASPRNGMEITFDATKFKTTELLTCAN